MEQYMAYCVKCKKKVPVENPQEVTLKNGKKAIKGICPYCKGTVYVFVKTKAAQ
jgi:DNA-directed RNA polymerase subunit RPC12/RpoP